MAPGSSIVASLLCLFIFSQVFAKALECNPKNFGFGSVACVCNETFCDSVTPLGQLAAGQVAVYTTSKAGDRLKRTDINISTTHTNSTADPDITVLIDPSIEMQEIVGFGGAFTDAAGINIASLSQSLQHTLLDGYFGPNGIEYTIGRVPMASCDFSTRVYSYDDIENDFDLKHFQLADEDTTFKIPYMKYAMKVARMPLRFFGSPWSAPGWMKNSGNMTGNGTLIGPTGSKYYKTWAHYFAKFIEAYRNHDIPIWAVTMQNEPTTGFVFNYEFQTMGFTPAMQRDFLKQDLGPLMEQLGVKVMILDDNRLMLPKWAKEVLSDPAAKQYASYIAVHWYMDRLVTAEVLAATHYLFPDIALIGTEACDGWHLGQYRGPLLGSWLRAQHYATSIMEDLSKWFTGWVDWNLALDMIGGPNWVRNFVDSPVIVDAKNNQFYRQPMYYVIGQFSKFLPPGSRRIFHRFDGLNCPVQTVVFKRPDNLIVLIMHNLKPRKMRVAVQADYAHTFRFDLPPNSIQTMLWKQKAKV